MIFINIKRIKNYVDLFMKNGEKVLKHFRHVAVGLGLFLSFH